jgi:hypothetical protein
MFARNLRNRRADDPALDKKSLASLALHFFPRVVKAGTLTSKTSPKLPYALNVSVPLGLRSIAAKRSYECNAIGPDLYFD